MSATTSTSAMANSNYHQLFHLHHRRLPVVHHRLSSQVSATIFNQHTHVKTNFLGNIQGLSIKLNHVKLSNITRNINMTVYAGILPGIPLPSSDNWKGWIIGVLISVVLVLLRNKIPFLALNDKVLKVVVSIDSVAETIEKVAKGVEKVADEVADHLPEGKLKEAARCVESIAHETAKDAHIADEFLDKVVEVGDELEKEVVKCVKEQASVVTADVVQLKEEAVNAVAAIATDMVQVREEVVDAVVGAMTTEIVQTKEEDVFNEAISDR